MAQTDPGRHRLALAIDGRQAATDNDELALLVLARGRVLA
jgi:hypothetical protein